MTGHMASSGRGGAGNMVDSTKSPKLQPKDLETPTLKTSVVTTGRGGTGNMARNTDPAETRARQDVGPVTRRDSSNGMTLVGRGGGGNVFKQGDAEAAKKARDESAVADEDLRRVATGDRLRGEKDKGKGKEGEKDKGKEKEGAKDKAADGGHGGLAQKGKDWLMGKRS